MRTFIAIEISEEIRDNLSANQERLKKTDAKVRWVKPGRIHLTLKFLGEIDDTQCELVTEALKEIVESAPPFRLEIQGMGGFPNMRRPSVIWAGVRNGNDDVTALAERVEDALHGLDFPKEKRPFAPHLTIGRVKSKRGIETLSSQVEDDSEVSFGEFQISEIVLFKSDLSPAGPTYSALGRFLLH